MASNIFNSPNYTETKKPSQQQSRADESPTKSSKDDPRTYEENIDAYVPPPKKKKSSSSNRNDSKPTINVDEQLASNENLTTRNNEQAQADYVASQYDKAKAQREMARNTAYDSQGRGYSIAPDVLRRQQNLYENRDTVFYNAQGQGFSANPDQVVISSRDRGYGVQEVKYGSGRSSREDTGTTQVYGRSYASDSDLFTKPKSRARQIYENPANPIQLIGQGARTTGEFVGIGLAESFESVELIRSQPIFMRQRARTGQSGPIDYDYNAVRNYGRGVARVQFQATTFYFGGGVVGKLAGSSPKVAQILNNKPVGYGLTALSIGGTAVGYSRAENKQRYLVDSATVLLAGGSGFKAGFKASFNARVNPNVKYVLTDTKVLSAKRVESMTTARSINTRIGGSSYTAPSDRSGIKAVKSSITPREYILKYDIIQGKKPIGQRLVYIDRSGSTSFLDRYTVGRQTVTREFNQVPSRTKSALAFEGVVRVSNKNIFGKRQTTDVLKGILQVPKSKDLQVSIDKLDFRRVRVARKNERLSQVQSQRTIQESAVNKQGFVRIISRESVRQKIKLEKPYIVSVLRERGVRLSTRGGKFQGFETVSSKRAVPRFGSKTYIDKIEFGEGRVSEVKYPQQISETKVKVRVSAKSTVRSDFSQAKFYSKSEYYRPSTSNTFAKMLSSKRGQVSIGVVRSRPERIEFAEVKPTLKASSLNVQKVGSVPTSIRAEVVTPSVSYINSRSKSSNISSTRVLNNVRVRTTPISKISLEPVRDLIPSVRSRNRSESISRSRTQSRTRVESIARVQQSTLLRTQQIFRPVSTPTSARSTRFRSPPFRPPVSRVNTFFIPKGSPASPKKFKSYGIVGMAPRGKRPKRKLDILPSLREVFIYEGLTGKEAQKPRKTKKIKKIFENQLFGRGSFGVTIPTEQGRRKRRL